MIALGAAEVAALTGGQLFAPAGEEIVVGGNVVRDSREVGAGDLFVAITGESNDGHAYAQRAHDAGAVLTLAERELPVPHVRVENTVAALGRLAAGVLARLREQAEAGGEKLTVLGVTGSAGKTTTKDLLAVLCAQLGPTVAPQASYNNEIGLPLTVLKCTEETRYLVLEMGASGPGHIDELTAIAPLDLAGVLMVGTAHLGGFGSAAAVAAAKAEILAGLVHGGVAVLNADDAQVAAMSAPGAKRLTFSASGRAATCRALDVKLDATSRASFDLEYAGVQSARVDLRLVGAHHVANALAAATFALELGLGVAEAAAVLSTHGPASPHRMDVRQSADGVLVIDDSYNANEDSMRAALRVLQDLAAPRREEGGRALAVLGEMLELGETSAEIHARVGQAAAQAGADVVIALGQAAEPLGQAAAAGGAQVFYASSPEQARELLDLRPGDVVLIKGSHGSGAYRLAEALN
ncbi:UDP-N-acetylmuramoyl-tripeptide--D-alanyl-D-alanine ligase [Buchananella felis]|uniref:UDP-N-acetylmuramoyl-tripeptide--D-alanyl-D- alanine ligase n=1 Tax=Buchananella felis TaxID=3231492 RepID=UPI0035279008